MLRMLSTYASESLRESAMGGVSLHIFARFPGGRAKSVLACECDMVFDKQRFPLRVVDPGIVEDELCSHWFPIHAFGVGRPVDKEAFRDIAGLCVPPVLMTMGLLACKNVRAIEQPCSPKLAKRYLERHGHNRPRYYVLDIEPMKQIIRKESSGETVTLAKALHICRGHFKNFDDKPLFGRLKGTYWWQPHVRGTAEAGVVEKDYRIKLP